MSDQTKPSSAAPTCRGLVTATREALSAAIASCAAGKPLKCIGEAVAEVVFGQFWGIGKENFTIQRHVMYGKKWHMYTYPIQFHVTGILT